MEETTVIQTKSSRAKLVDYIKESIAIYGGLTGLFIAIFWIVGRFYTAGFFASMNIPSYHVKFSIWEYSETSWYLLIGMISILIIFVGFMVILRQIVKNPIAYLNQLLAKRFSKNIKNPKQKPSFPISQKVEVGFQIITLGLSGIYLLIIILAMMILSYRYGEYQGRNRLTNEGYQVDIISKEPLSFDASIPASTIEQPEITSYKYEGFKLLTFNEGRYYLFNRLDPIDCKPIEVYIIEKSVLIQVNLSTSPSSAYNCIPSSP